MALTRLIQAAYRLKANQYANGNLGELHFESNLGLAELDPFLFERLIRWFNTEQGPKEATSGVPFRRQ